MTRSAMFVDAAKRDLAIRWCERFRQKISVPADEITVETSFGRTHALVAGPPDAPPLVVVHGALASSAHVLPELGPLVETRRIHAIDVLGQSAWSEDRRLPLDDDSYPRWLLETCDRLGLGRFALLGVSWGGFVASRAAISAPDRLTHLVLMVPAGLVANDFWPGFRDAGWPFLLYRMAPSKARFERFARSVYTTLDPEWTEWFGDALRSYRFDIRVPPLAKAGELDGIRCPTLVFGAEHDAQFPGARLLVRAKELVPHAEVELLEGSRHCPPLTDAFRRWLASRVEAFLSGRADRPQRWRLPIAAGA
jgi:pimeloyl-ACP methyl ester carboxylesterase